MCPQRKPPISRVNGVFICDMLNNCYIKRTCRLSPNSSLMEPTRTPSSPTPSPESRFERITTHAQGVVDDVRQWVDLRLDLAVMDLETTLDERLNKVAVGIIMAVFGGLAAFFMLTTVAIGLGWLLGHAFWGFLIVTVGLATVAFVMKRTQPTLVQTDLYRQWRQAKAKRKEAKARASDISASETSEEEPSSDVSDETPASSSSAASNNASSSTSSS